MAFKTAKTCDTPYQEQSTEALQARKRTLKNNLLLYPLSLIPILLMPMMNDGFSWPRLALFVVAGALTFLATGYGYRKQIRPINEELERRG